MGSRWTVSERIKPMMIKQMFLLVVEIHLLLLVPLLSAFARPSQPTIVFQSTRRAWPNQEWDIYTMDLSGGNVRQLTKNPGHDADPDWSPDGTKIAFFSRSNLALMDCDGNNFHLLMTNTALPANPDWSPDGTKLAFSAGLVNDRRDIFVLKLATGEVRQLTNHPRNDDTPSWSPDGRWIVFESNRDPQFWELEPDGHLGAIADLYIMDAEGNNLRNLTQTKVHEMMPAWSPDGTQIAFSVARSDLTNDLYVVNGDGSRRRQLTTFPNSFVLDPSWSPDNQFIIFDSSDRRKPEEGEAIYIIDRDGGNLRQFPRLGLRDTHPSWFGDSLAVSPRGKQTTTWGNIKRKYSR
jgi:TolB protein